MPKDYTNNNLPVLRPRPSITDTSVTSINGFFPDATGNVTINIGVMTINHVEPDESGDIEYPTLNTN